MTNLSHDLPMIILNVNGLNMLVKRQWKSEFKNISNYLHSLHETHFKYNNIDSLKVKRQKEIHHANINEWKAGVAILLSDKVNFKIKKITRDTKRYHIIRVNLPRRYSNPKCV